MCNKRNSEEGQHLSSSRHYSTLHMKANLVLEMETDIMPIYRYEKLALKTKLICPSFHDW